VFGEPNEKPHAEQVSQTDGPPASFRLAIAYGLVRPHVHIMADSYESSLAALNDIITRYRARLVGDSSRPTLTREQAVVLIKALGFTEGDAMRWLDAKPSRP
jgi:hypothetical protein